MSHNIRFHYFPVRARGEHLRYILHQSGRPFEEEVMNPQKWPEFKPKTPFGSLPMITIDGKTQISQSLVVGQFLAAELGLAGRDHLEASRVFMLAHGVSDCHEALIAKQLNQLLVPFFNKMDWDAAAKLWQEDLKPNTWAPFCERYTKFLQENGGTWLVGDRVSWADLFLAELGDRLTKVVDPNCLDPYPLLKEHCKRVHELPNIKKYVSQRKPFFEKDW